MAYTRGSSTNIIVGAASLFTFGTTLTEADLPAYTAAQSFREDLSDDTDFTNVGYTMNGLELQFQPDFGEVQVDQVLDVAKLYKQGMQVNMNTTFAEATLENLLVAIAASNNDLSALTGTGIGSNSQELLINSGNLGECPVERGLVAVGPGTGDCAPTEQVERVYVAYRALSIDNVTVSAKRDEASMFDVSFRLLPNDSGAYGKVVDRTIPAV
jgi:hypothetical protein